MRFKAAIKSGFIGYADFKGRSSRAEFWYWVLFFWSSYLTAIFLEALILSGMYSPTSSGPEVLLLPANLVVVALLIPNISVFVRRLHDTDRKGWWSLLHFIPFGGFFLLVWLCSSGTPGANRFGEKGII